MLPRVVLDANVLISGLIAGGPPAALISAWLAGRFGNAHLTELVGPSPPVLDPRAFLDLLESG